MTLKLRVIHTEAAAAFARVQALPYDPLDAAETAFVADCAAYQSTKQELERRLAAIISQAMPISKPDMKIMHSKPLKNFCIHACSKHKSIRPSLKYGPMHVQCCLSC